MKGNAIFAIFKDAVCQKCRQSHGIEEDDEIFTLKCKNCGAQAEQVPAWEVKQ